MTRHFLNAEAQARWAAARFDAIRTLGRIAAEERCEFIVVAGDVFESNQVDRRTIVKACEAMAAIAVPTFVLPANHDPLDAGSVFLSAHWNERKPASVRVLHDRSPVQVRPGVEVVGAPWTSRRPLNDLVAAAGADLAADPGTLRIMVGHGAVDTLSPDRDNPALICVADAERTIADGKYHYLALGDRHSYTHVGVTGRICYSGTHEAYDFDEVDPGKVLIVELGANSVTVDARQTGGWRFIVHEAHVSTAEDLDALARHIDSIEHKDRTVLKLGLVGTLSVTQHARLEAIEEHARDLFAAVVRSGSRSELVVRPDSADFADLMLAGFAAATAQKLSAQAERPGAEGERAGDALALLLRLAERPA